MVVDLFFLMQEQIVESCRLLCVVIEMLVIIVYYQFVICVEIEEICGVVVNCGMLDQLIELEWVWVGCRWQMLGCLVIFVVMEIFLDYFLLESVCDLFGLVEFCVVGLFEFCLFGVDILGLFFLVQIDEDEGIIVFVEDFFEDD